MWLKALFLRILNNAYSNSFFIFGLFSKPFSVFLSCFKAVKELFMSWDKLWSMWSNRNSCKLSGDEGSRVSSRWRLRISWSSRRDSFSIIFHTAGLFPVVRDMYESVFFVNNEVLWRISFKSIKFIFYVKILF